ncbi:MAG: TnsD family Tn7-like transposition protein [Negativicutes bacterium]|nr:TnsD family Tn7-like transposition protein [Negativicutes bacterium]
MLQYFPSLYDNELLLSAIRRGYDHASKRKPQNVSDHLYFAAIDLPTRLQRIMDETKLGSVYNASEIIRKHTLFPLVTAFAGEQLRREIEKGMIGETAIEQLRAKLGLRKSLLQPLIHPHVCLKCDQEDLKNLGETYWYRAHNVPGVMVCYKHGELLYKYGADRPIAVIKNDKVVEHSMQFALDVHTMLNTSACFDPETTKRWFLEKMIAQGYATSSRRLKRKEITIAIHDFYGIDFLQSLDCVIENQDSAWPFRLVQQTCAAHPIKYMLAIRFLYGSIQAFLDDPVFEYTPFGSGPWPCLNVAGDHHLQEVVKECKIKTRPDSDIVSGIFTCECGFIYQRTGPDIQISDRHRYDYLVRHGQVWEERLRHLRQEHKMSIRKIADELKCGKTVAELALKKIYERQSSRHNHMLDERKKLIVEIMRRNPEYGRRDLFQTKEYKWLKKYVREWLYSEVPAKPRNSGRKKTKDLKAEDGIILQRAKVIAEGLFNAFPFQRIFRSGVRELLSKDKVFTGWFHPSNYPKSAEFLTAIAESNFSYQARQILWAVDQLESNGQDVCSGNIIKVLGRKPKYLGKILNLKAYLRVPKTWAEYLIYVRYEH